MEPYFILYVSDQARARAFYGAVLMASPRLDVPGMTEFAVGAGSVLGLMPEAGIVNLLAPKLPDPKSAQGVPRAELYLLLPDRAADHHARALQAGAQELSPMLPRDWGHTAGYCLDPDGHVLAFAEPTAAVARRADATIGSIVIRPAREDDAAALLALRRLLYEETSNLLYEPGEYRATIDDERDGIARTDKQPNSLCLVADDQGQLVGFLFALGGQVHRRRHAATLALGVRRSHWGRGIATALLQEALAWSRGAGLTRVELTVHTSNERAVALYRRCGFAIEGTRCASLCVDGRYVDEYLMSVVNLPR